MAGTLDFLNQSQRSYFDGVEPNQYLKDFHLLRMFLMNGQGLKDVAKIKTKTMVGTGVEWAVPSRANVSGGVFGAYDTYPLQPTNPITNAFQKPSWYLENCVISEMELSQNSGAKEKLLDMQKTQLENTMNTMRQRMANDIYLPGTEFAPDKRSLTGMQTIVNDGAGANGKVYANIDRTVAGNEFWKSYRNNTAISLASLKDPNNDNSLPNVMRALEMKASFDNMRPDVIVMDKGMYNLYKQIAQVNNLRFDYNEADLSFDVIKFGTTTIMYDDYLPNADKDLGIGGGVPHTIYAFTSKDWDVYTYVGKNMQRLGDWTTMLPNKSVYALSLVWFGVVTCKQPRRQAVADNLAAS